MHRISSRISCCWYWILKRPDIRPFLLLGFRNQLLPGNADRLVFINKKKHIFFQIKLTTLNGQNALKYWYICRYYFTLAGYSAKKTTRYPVARYPANLLSGASLLKIKVRLNKKKYVEYFLYDIYPIRFYQTMTILDFFSGGQFGNWSFQSIQFYPPL